MLCVNCNSTNIEYNKNLDSYICNSCGHVFTKQYFFISYSHLDIEKVRIVRNIVEETFFYEPILFFLKCLSEDNEIIDLIRREINERIWFIYCKSKNAENSKYVCEERRYIEWLKSKGYNKKILTVDLDNFKIGDAECANDIRRQVEYQIRKTKIFVSYRTIDIPIVEKIINRLSEMGFTLWYDKKLPIGANWFDECNSKIEEYSHKDGIFMPIFNGDITSPWMLENLAVALQNDAFVLPVVLTVNGEMANIDESIRRKFENFNWVPFNVEDFENSMYLLNDHIKRI